MTNNNIFKLSFDKTVTRLAGFDYGHSVYKTQIENRGIDYDIVPITIEFPDHIILAASSFTQGFFEVIIQKYGYNALDNQVRIIAKNESLICSIKKNLM